MNVFRAYCRSAIIPLFLVAAGCGEPVDPRVAALQKQFVLATAPSGERTVSSIRNEFLEPEDSSPAPAEIDVVIRGRINAGELPPWESGKTAFVLTDATGHSEGDGHDPHTCPFCSRKIEDYVVQVSFRDAAGKLIEIDSREAFGLQEQQLLVITGKARIEDKVLKVDATGLYFVKPGVAPNSADEPSEEAIDNPGQ